MKSTPKGWPRITTSIVYDDPRKAIDWLCEAFGFEVALKVEGEGERIEHCQLVFGDGMVMTASERPERGWLKSPRALGGACTQALMVFVDDADAHCRRAQAAGAKVVTEPKTSDYGEDYWTDRSYECEDLEGHHWYFVQRIRGPKS